MLPPPAPIEATSVTGSTVWYLSKTGRALTSGSPSTTRPTSKLVPPTSVVITFGKPSACPSAAAPTTPPAGPDATSLIACPFAFAVDVTPPEDCMTSGARRRPQPASCSSSAEIARSVVPLRYAFSIVVAPRSYSLITGATSLEAETRSSGYSLRIRSATARSWLGLMKLHRKEIAIASTPASTSSATACRASSRFRGTISAPL
jgi:hypothetical protein